MSTPSGTDGVNHPSVLSRPYVILVSFDGFRASYLDQFETPAFDRLARAGLNAEALITVFPSLTFPGHYSIATGLYPERHGIVGNRFYDPVRNDAFDYRDDDDAGDGTWWGGEPIWVTAETQGMVAAALFFPGTEAAIQNIRPTHWRRYDSRLPNRERVDEVLEWLAAPPETRPHLMTLYFSLVDRAGHRGGPSGSELRNAVDGADALLGRLVDGVDRLPHANRVYIVVVSDHGIAVLDPARQLVLPDIVDLDGVRAVPNGPNLSLYLGDDQDRARQIRDDINAGTLLARAYLRDEVPEHLHHRASPRIGDVVIIPVEGASARIRPDPTPPAGMHGWDPTLTSMHGLFLARGPRLPAGRRIPAFESVHVYPLLAQILGLRSPPGLDGRPEILGALLDPVAVE